MGRYLIDGVVVTSDLEDMTEAEARAYLDAARKKAMGDVTRLSIWNNAKQAEEQDRVKHIGGRG